MRITLVALSFVMGFAGAASAQTAGNTNGTANAANSVVVNAYTGMGNGNGTTGAGTSSGTGTNPTGTTTTTEVHYSGHEWSTPSVQGSYFAGANPCLVGIGGSGAGGPIGLSFTFGRSDQGCQRRSDAAAWHALGHDDVAVARMCQDDDNSAAFESVGFVCPQNRAKVIPAAARGPSTSNNVGEPNQQAMNGLQQISLSSPMMVPPSGPAAQTQIRTNRPDWCNTVTGSAERLHYKQACEF